MKARNLDIVFSKDHDVLVDHIFERIEHHLHSCQEQRSFLIVPEPMKVDMERHFITKTNIGGIMMTEVLSFRRLATRLFAESGIPMPKPLSNAGKAILAQKILLDQKIPFRTFRRIAGQPRYAAELVHILGDFRRYEISSDELLQIDSKNRATNDKFHDFALLKNALEEEMEHRGLGDPDCTLTHLASMLLSSPLPGRLGFLTSAHVWVVGFGADRQFTSQEMNVLRGLASHVSGLTITVTADYPGGNRGELAFQHGRATIESLHRVFPGIRCNQAAPRPVVKTTINLSANNMRPSADIKGDVQLIEAINMHEEARYCAGKIRELLLDKDKNIRRREIGIALCNDQQMSNIMETTLAEYDIDAWVDTRRPLLQSSFARTFSSFLSLCSYDFSFDQLMDYYRGGLSPLSDDVIDSFENAALELGWMTARDFRELAASPALLEEELANRFQGSCYEQRAVRTALNDVFQLLTITSDMRGLRNGHDKSELLLEFLFSGKSVSLAERVKLRSDTLVELKRQDSATLLVSSWNAIVDLLRECRELLGKTRISQEHYTKLLLAGLEGLILPAVPLGADHVRVGSLKAMATWPCRVLFILGATATAFPPESKQQGYLRDEERDLLSKEINKPFPNRQKDDPSSQAWLINMLLSQPTNILFVSVPTLGEDEQSYVFDSLKVKTSTRNNRLKRGTPERFNDSNDKSSTIDCDTKDQKPINLRTIDEPGRVPDVRWNALKAAQRILRWNKEAPATLRTAVGAIEAQLADAKKEKARRERAHHREDRPLPALAYETAENMMLPVKLATEIATSRTGVSASLLQQYNACPFSYFAEYIACATERVVAKDKPNLQGTLLHRLVELATKDLTDRLQNAESAEIIGETTALWRRDVDSADYMRRLYREATADRGLGWYGWPSSSGSVGERLRLHASRTIQSIAAFSQEEGYSPRFLEWYFPNEASKPYLLRVNDVDFVLRGKIDHIEENHAGNVRIIDFKRSGKEFSWVDLYDGTDIQLPLYKLAFEAAYPERKVDELYFCGFEGPGAKDLDLYDNAVADKDETRQLLEKQKKLWDPGIADRTAQFAEQKALETINSIVAGQFPANPTIRGTTSNPCSYCNWRAACGYDNRLKRNKPLPSGSKITQQIRDEILGSAET